MTYHEAKRHADELARKVLDRADEYAIRPTIDADHHMMVAADELVTHAARTLGDEDAARILASTAEEVHGIADDADEDERPTIRRTAEHLADHAREHEDGVRDADAWDARHELRNVAHLGWPAR